MSTAFLENKRKIEWGGPWQARRAFQQERDGMVIGLVDHYEVMTRELLCALLDWQRTLPNLKMAEKLLRRLGSQGHFHQIAQDGITYAVTLAISLRKKGERKQLAHRYMGARRSSTLDRAMACDENAPAGCSGHKAEGLSQMNSTGLVRTACSLKTMWAGIILHRTFRRNPRSTTATATTSNNYTALNLFTWSGPANWPVVLQRSSRLCRDRPRRHVPRVPRRGVSPFDPLSILQPIFHSPHDHCMHRLLEDPYA